MAPEVMDPAFFSQLCHYGVDERVASFRLFPGIEIYVVLVPLYLFANWVAFDFIEIRSKSSVEIEKLSP